MTPHRRFRAQNGWTPLHHAAWASISWLDETTTASLLLGKGADPLAKCKDGTTPLELCSSSPELRSLLLRAAEGNGAAAPGSCVASGLAALRAGGGDDLDLVLECSGEELRCHSLVLAAQSDYWKALCYGPMATCAALPSPTVAPDASHFLSAQQSACVRASAHSSSAGSQAWRSAAAGHL